MKIIDYRENPNLSAVYLADFGDDKVVEFADSLQPPLAINEKWVIIISTLFGCPVKCKMCDAGNSGRYQGILTAKQMFDQIDYAIKKRFPKGIPDIKKLKIQFARMGEPAFNLNVLQVLKEMPERYKIKGLLPSISTIAPANTDKFFDELIEIKDKYYSKGNFQLQFSIHTTDEKKRDWLIPIKKWSFPEIAKYGERFYKKGDRKITLNFALAKDSPLDPEILIKYFSPTKFLVKITPLNPTCQAKDNKLESFDEKELDSIVCELNKLGYKTIISIGELEENEIGTNCGQYVTKYLKEKNNTKLKGKSYNYWD